MNDVLKTLKYNKYFIHFDLKNNQPILTCINYISVNEKKQNKENIFASINDLGRNIYKNIPNNVHFNISLILEKTLKNKREYNNKEIFSNLNELILLPNIKKVLIEWFNENGIPNFFYSENYINKSTKINSTKENSDLEYLNIENLNILFGTNSYNVTDFYKSIDYFYRYDINLLPLVNLALIVYFAYTLKNRIANVRTDRLNQLLKPFPYLLNEYENKYIKKLYLTDSEKEAKLELLETINNYFKLLIYYFQKYLNEEIEITNNTEIIFPENINIPTSEAPWKELTFMTTRYVSLNPFLTAFEYLLQILPIKKSIMRDYSCEECDKMIAHNQHLCYDCKMKLYDEVINKCKKQKNEDKQKKYKAERNNLLEDEKAYTPLIEKIHYDRKYQRIKYAQKCKKN